MTVPTYDSSKLLSLALPSALVTGLDPFVKPDLVRAFGKLFLFMGPYEDNRFLDGTRCPVMSGVAPALPSVSATAPSGAGETGTFWYTYTLFDPTDSTETGPGADLASTVGEIWAKVVLAAQDATFNIPNPASGSRFTRARVYRNIKYSVDMRQLTGVTGSLADVVLTPGAGGTVTFTDSFTVADATLRVRDRLNVRKRFNADGLPPKFKTGFFHGNRLYGSAGDNIVWFSELAPYIEDVPTKNKVTLEGGPGDDNPKIVAARVSNSQRYIWTQGGLYMITGSTPPFGIECVATRVGAMGTHSTIPIANYGTGFLGRDRPQIHLGGPDVRPMGTSQNDASKNPVEDLYQECDRGRLKDSVADVDTDNGILRLSFAENGQPVNNRTLVNEYTLKKNAWSMDTGRWVTRWGRMSDKSGRQYVVFGNDLGQVWQADLGNSEGAYGAVVSGAITAATRLTLTRTGLTQAAIQKGFPVTIRDTTTGEVLYRNRVLAYETISGILQVLHPWTMADVSTLVGKTVEVGSIEGVYETGWIPFTPGRFLGRVWAVYLYYVTNEDGTVRVLYGLNQKADRKLIHKAVPLTGDQQRLFVRDFGAEIKVRIEGTAPGEDFALVGFDIDIMPKDFRG